MISAIWGWLADGACQTVACSYGLDLGSETDHSIQVKVLLFDHA